MKKESELRPLGDAIGCAGSRGGGSRMLHDFEERYGEVHRRTTRRYAVALLCVAAAVGLATTALAWPQDVVVSKGADRGALTALTQQMVERL